MYTDFMGLSLEQFEGKYNHKTCTHRLGIAGECVCLYRCYLDQVLGVPQSPTVSQGAKQIWTTYLPQYFERIQRKNIFDMPRKGDIVIFSAFPGNPKGHVGIALSATPLSFKSFDSNWSVYHKAGFEIHTYRYVLGWLHRRGYVGVTDDVIKSLYRTIWMREPAYGDWFYFRRRIELGTIIDSLDDLQEKINFTFLNFKKLGDDWWQHEKDKVLLP